MNSNAAVPADLSEDELVQSPSGHAIKSVYVFEVPVRLWHWINALALTILAVSGYFIGSPLPSLSGEASDHFLMGYIRFAHFAAGYVLAVGLLGRVYWAFVGNYHAREMFWAPISRPAFWTGVAGMIRWYTFTGPRPVRYTGHNPAARLAMIFVFLLTTVFMIFTGFALYSEGAQIGSWQDKLFGWVIPLFGQSQDVHTYHHLGMWVLVTFTIIHVYSAFREDIMGRSSIISTMISGHRTFKD